MDNRHDSPAAVNPHGPSGSLSTAAIITIVIAVIIVAVVVGLLQRRQSPNPAPAPAATPSPTTTQELPPLPEKFYSVSGTVQRVEASSFTVAARIRTESTSVADGFQDVVLTVRYDSATRFRRAGTYTEPGVAPTPVAATAADVAVGTSVTVRGRDNIRGLTEFTAAEIEIRNVQ